jgi:hypothetical protein
MGFPQSCGSELTSVVSHGILTMEIISRLRRLYAFIRGNFLILVMAWTLMNFTGPTLNPR